LLLGLSDIDRNYRARPVASLIFTRLNWAWTASNLTPLVRSLAFLALSGRKGPLAMQ